MYDNTFL